jgi:hypothetical protein
MAQVLGCAVEVHDDNSRPSMFDFAFELADGRLGAAEMTTITDPIAREWQALRNRQHTIPNTSLAFRVVRNGAQVRANDVLRHLPRLAELAETCDESDINRLAQQLQFSGDLAIEWLNGCGARITGLRNHAHPGAVYFDGDGGGSFVPDNMDGLIDWLNEELASERFDSEFAKLTASGRTEQHLVLRIDMPSRMPNEHWFALTETSAALPSTAPAPPGRIMTGLWLIPDYGKFIVSWMNVQGWRKHDLLS